MDQQRDDKKDVDSGDADNQLRRRNAARDPEDAVRDCGAHLVVLWDAWLIDSESLDLAEMGVTSLVLGQKILSQVKNRQ